MIFKKYEKLLYPKPEKFKPKPSIRDIDLILKSNAPLDFPEFKNAAGALGKCQEER